MHKELVSEINGIIMGLMHINTILKDYDKSKIESINKQLEKIRANNVVNLKIQNINEEKETEKLTKRKDGRWMGRFRMKDGKYKYVYSKDKKECSKLLEKAIEEYENGLNDSVLSGKMSIGGFLTYYLNEIIDVKEGTLVTYKRVVNVIKDSNPNIMSKPVERITFEDLNNIMKNVNNGYKQIACGILKNGFSKLKEIGYIKYNYSALLKSNKINENAIRNPHNYVSIDNFYNALSKVKSKEVALGYQIAMFCGTRIGELVALKWEDVDFELKQIRINKTYNEKTNKTTTTKTSNGVRLVPIVKGLFNILYEYKKSNCCMDADLIMKSTSYRTFTQRPILRIHDLRHSYATNCYIVGRDLKNIQYWMGHSTISMTMDVYTHVPNISDDAKSRINDLFDTHF